MITELQGIVDGQVIDSKVRKEGVTPAVTLASAEVYTSPIANFTGQIVVVDKTNESSAVATCHVHNGVQVISSVTGSANIGSAADTASKLNVYVAGGSVTIQNLTGDDAVVVANIV